MTLRSVTLAAIALAAFTPTAIAAPIVNGAIVASIPGPDGGWDYASVDPATNRLFVAHGESIASVDLAKPARATSFAPAHHAHAVLPIPDRDEILVTDGDTATARFLDARTGAVRASVAVGTKPDAAIWDAKRRRVVVMNAKSGTVVMIDPVAAKVVSTVTLVPGLEFAAFDAQGRLYVNNEDANTVTVIDPDAGTVLATIVLPGCDGPTGMAYAAKADRIVSACGNGVAAIVDPNMRRSGGTLPIGRGADAVIADPVRGRLYIPSGGNGTLSVLQDAGSGVTVRATIATEVGARTGAVDPRTGLIYLPTARLAAASKPGTHSTPVPGTFHILVLKPHS